MASAGGAYRGRKLVTFRGIGQGVQKKMAKYEAAKDCLEKLQLCSSRQVRERAQFVLGKQPVSILNELCQALALPPPNFYELEGSGPFRMECVVQIEGDHGVGGTVDAVDASPLSPSGGKTVLDRSTPFPVPSKVSRYSSPPHSPGYMEDTNHPAQSRSNGDPVPASISNDSCVTPVDVTGKITVIEVGDSIAEKLGLKPIYDLSTFLDNLD